VITARRALILEELGLLPRWVPRAKAWDAVEPPDSSIGAVRLRVPDPALGRAKQLESSSAALPPLAHPTTRSELDTTQRVARMSWPDLKEAVRSCTACPLYANRKQTVFGVGDERAEGGLPGEQHFGGWLSGGGGERDRQARDCQADDRGDQHDPADLQGPEP